MALACQRNSYLQELKTRVKSIEKASIKITKKEKIEGCEVILEDTVLFPEGGGQPDDRGTIAGSLVTRVRRDGDKAVHFLPNPEPAFKVGEEVHVVVDWGRRFDHMIQHSAQHLITAIADRSLGYPTTSWNLGEKVSSIELETPSMSEEQMEKLERDVNVKIRDALPVYPTLFANKAALEEDLKKSDGFRQAARGLPDDHVGPLRIVTITGVENNMCCGTHVANTSHLQSVKLLGVEKGKKGKTNLMFVAGARVLDTLGCCIQREKAMTGLLKGCPESHADLVDKLQKNFKSYSKSLTNLMREAAMKEVESVKRDPPKNGLVSFHAKEGDNEYMNMIVNGLESEPVVVFITNGDEKKEGNFVLSFPLTLAESSQGSLAKEVMVSLEAKGFGKNGRWQGKVARMSNRSKAESLVSDWIASSGLLDKDEIYLFTYPENPNAYKGMICASFSGVTVRVMDRPPAFVHGVTDTSPQFLAKFPSGKLPALEVGDLCLNESNAIALFLSGPQLRGETRREEAENARWMEFSNNRLVPSLTTWVYSVMGVIVKDDASLKKSVDALKKSLRVIDDHLLYRTFLVKERISVADVVVAADLLLGFERVFSSQFLDNFVNLRRWFTTIINQKEVMRVLGERKLLA